MKRKSKKTARPQLKWTFILLLIGVSAYYTIDHFNKPTGDSVELGELPEGFYSHGIDISHYQDDIDWAVLSKLLDSTISFVYCKSTEGVSYVDPAWKENRNQLTQLNVKHGAYHFFLPSMNAPQQAKHFLKHYSFREGDLPPVLDAETEGATDKILIQGMKSWLKLVERKTGVRPVIYTSYHFYKTKFRGKFDDYEFWIASYNSNEKRLSDDCIIHWQYTDLGIVQGINGFVDLNFSKNRR
ncbi:MAG: lysozyme [Flavobacteriaceae bacterium]